MDMEQAHPNYCIEYSFQFWHFLKENWWGWDIHPFIWQLHLVKLMPCSWSIIHSYSLLVKVAYTEKQHLLPNRWNPDKHATCKAPTYSAWSFMFQSEPRDYTIARAEDISCVIYSLHAWITYLILSWVITKSVFMFYYLYDCNLTALYY